MACIKVSGETPSQSDVFTMVARMPASSGNRRFTNDLGAGSSEQCLAGVRPTILIISSALVSRSTERLLQHLLLIAIEVAPEVVALIVVSTLEWKRQAKSSAVCDQIVHACGIFSNVVIYDQRALESLILDLMALVQ
jgi:hypothetical protein